MVAPDTGLVSGHGFACAILNFGIQFWYLLEFSFGLVARIQLSHYNRQRNLGAV